MQNNLEVADDPQVVANGYLVRSETADGTEFPLVATPVQFDGKPSSTRRAPDFNEHGDDILRELAGLDDEQLIDAKIRNVIA